MMKTSLLLILFCTFLLPVTGFSQITPTQIGPSGTTGGNPTITWSGSGEWFQIWVSAGTSAGPGASMISDQYGQGKWLQAPSPQELALDGSVLTNGMSLPPGNYVWYVRSWVSGVTSAWSAGMDFHVVAGRPAGNVYPVPGMRWVKPGTFVMGSHPNEVGRDGDENQHTVTLTKGFYVGTHEVTQAEYVAVTQLSNPSANVGDTNRPVESVTWNEAVAYCAALTTAERSAGRIPAGWAYRLPTEAEWEYCCRAGAGTTRFCYDDDIAATVLGEYAWTNANSGATTQPVGQKRGNAWGLHDMHGNVWEWCQDYYGAYPAGSVINPQGPSTGSNRVIRGGSWVNSATLVRCSNRDLGIPSGFSLAIGFRVVLATLQ